MSMIPKSLAGQLSLLLVSALVVAQAAAFCIFQAENSHAWELAMQARSADRVSTLVRVLQAIPQDSRANLLEAIGSRGSQYWISTKPLLAFGEVSLPERGAGSRPVSRQNDGVVRFARRPPPVGDAASAARETLAFSARIEDDTWLNAEMTTRLPRTPFANIWLALLSASILAILAVVYFGVRLITRPLRLLAKAADRVGRSEDADQPLPQSGPRELQLTIHAFNRMQARVKETLDDRLAICTAISHDLRTPLTAARLRCEMVEDPEVRMPLLRSLKTVQDITEATLTFARGEIGAEKSRAIDLGSLVEAVVDDLRAAGHNVSFEAGDHLELNCRPVLLRRAISNLITNASIYGSRARVFIRCAKDNAQIIVDDDGPGLPADDLERVFKPFVRLDQARNVDGGSVGLGLTIARSILRSHRGEVSLSNQPRGLRAQISLPLR